MKQGVEHTFQGRCITLHEIEAIKNLIASNPSWNPTCISKELCLPWYCRLVNLEFPRPHHEGFHLIGKYISYYIPSLNIEEI